MPELSTCSVLLTKHKAGHRGLGDAQGGGELPVPERVDRQVTLLLIVAYR